MKKATLFSIALIMLFSTSSCLGQTSPDNENATVSKANDIEVYYFHFSRRCVTCKEVESVSAGAVKELFGDSIPFKGFNLDEPEGKAKAKELNVSGQTLLIANGEKRINITNEGFMYARSNPEKLKQIISDHITPML